MTRPAHTRASTSPSSSATHSFSEVFREHGGYVLGLLRRLGVASSDVEDVAQEVFVVVHRNLPHFEGRSSVKTWLCGICLRTASTYRRGLGRRRERLTPAVRERRVDADQEHKLERDETRGWLEQAIEALPERQREVFVLFEIEELSMEEVAQAVGCPASTAYGRLYAARDAVRARIARVQRRRPA
ncbi:MAG: sigma-70 family RNA polymerase sigma factor [Myxococcales bacterium]|nr:sigma-70 family RNA polymerase sigma factor [Myxococcales bacterium]